MTKKWETYEEVSVYLLDKIRDELNLSGIEGKQKLIGKDTGTEWEVDAKGISEGTIGIILVECRRYTTSKQNQDKVAALAYRIQDTRSEGGIIVSPLGLQEGAKKVAAANNIKSIEIDANSTPHNFTMKFLNHIFVGVTIEARVTVEATDTVTRKCSSCGTMFEPNSSEVSCKECNVA